MRAARTLTCLHLPALVLALVGCADFTSSTGGGEDEASYRQPPPVQLDPPPNYTLRPDVPLVKFNTEREVVEMQVFGARHRPIHAMLDGSTGKRTLSVLVGLNRHIQFAQADYHLFATGASDANGDIMLCWNTLNGEPSEYSPDTPDPARGMTLHCRLMYADESLGPIEQIRVPTVGCWIRKLLPLREGGFRLLYKGDDGWFEARHDKPMHGTYEAIYDGDAWSKPELILPVPDPTQEQEVNEQVRIDPPPAETPAP